MNKGLLAALSLAAALSAGSASAQGKDERGLYLGGSVGYSQYTDVCQRTAVPCDDHDVGWRAFAGYQFNRNWQAEVGGGYFGEATGSGPFNGGTGTFNWESYGLDLSGLGHIYITGGLSVFGRLGIYMGRTVVDQSDPINGNTSDGKTNSGFTYGLGASLAFGPFAVRAEWQRYDNIGTNTIGTTEVDIFSIGALIRF